MLNQNLKPKENFIKNKSSSHNVTWKMIHYMLFNNDTRDITNDVGSFILVNFHLF